MTNDDIDRARLATRARRNPLRAIGLGQPTGRARPTCVVLDFAAARARRFEARASRAIPSDPPSNAA